MASSKMAYTDDARKAATRQRIATSLGREYQGYKPGGDPRAAMNAVMARPVRPAPTPAGGAAAPVSGMGGAGGTQQMIKNGGMTKKSGRDGCAIRGKTRA